MLVRHCLHVWQHSQGKERAARWLKLQLNQRTTHVSCSCPCSEEKIQELINSHGEGWGPSRSEGETGLDIIIWSVSIDELWNAQKANSHQPGEPYWPSCLILVYHGKWCITRWQWRQAIRIPVLECKHWPGYLEKTRNSQSLEVPPVKSNAQMTF